MNRHQTQEFVLTVLDERSASVPEELFHRVLAAQSIAAEDLHCVARHFEGGLGAEDLDAAACWNGMSETAASMATRRESAARGFDLVEHLEESTSFTL